MQRDRICLHFGLIVASSLNICHLQHIISHRLTYLGHDAAALSHWRNLLLWCPNLWLHFIPGFLNGSIHSCGRTIIIKFNYLLRNILFSFLFWYFACFVWLLSIILTFVTVIGATECASRRVNDAESIQSILNHQPSERVSCATSDAHHTFYSSYVVITAHWNLHLIWNHLSPK